MRAALCCLLLSVAAGAHADALSEANRLLAEKSWPEARHAFEQLAKAGNAEAKLRLGEMFWYGDGGPPDRVRGDALFAEAAAAGNAQASQNLTLSNRRAARLAEITYWVEQYSGEDLVAAEHACEVPALPDVSRNKAQVRSAAGKYADWTDCMKSFAESLSGSRAAGNRIPGDLAELMSSDEARKAGERLNGAYARVYQMAQEDMQMGAARYLAWEKATRDYLTENQKLLAFERDEKIRELNADIRRHMDARMESVNANMTLPPAPTPPASR